ncbi:Uncharacterised protein [Legionella steigerwaltii]|uniref:Uncharacterized protein n=1 Tax=Legionella steigerwaltii TaxID=460 RepID=A0A378L6A8_9GAMM|nr:hypothetical protein [Legionella steigerwaltii]KTD69792.1 hypothetical protein Lstg_3411 [Legionella steigerwaltii]STY21452.1 Uncharacterised protein [Legionella steigerwaltii]
MPTQEAHDNLIAEIGQIKTTEKHKLILELIHQKQYNKALLHGCENCVTEDTALTELLTVLIRSREALSLDVNIKENGFSPIDYTIVNQNYTLHFLLEKANANANKLLKPVWMQLLSQAVYKIAAHSNAEYMKACTSIDALFNKLPLKNEFLTDQENAQSDIKRLICLLHIIRHLAHYHKNLHDSTFVECQLSPFEREVLYYQRIDYIRECMTKFSIIISNLSGSLRGKYKTLLAPLSWITLEQLGGATAKTSPNMIFLLSLEKKLTDLHFDDAEQSLFQENSEREELIEEAIPSVLSELDALNVFFTSLLTKELQPTALTTVRPLVLPNVKAITRYFLETKYLIDLLNLVNYFDRETYDQKGVDTFSSGIKILISTSSPSEQYRRRLDLSTKAGQHAMLRRFQRIGELLTGKKSDFTEFDETIDFRALIAIRDGICHQDEGNNKFIIDNLLKDKGRLEKMATVEMYSLFVRVMKFIEARQKIYGTYKEDPKNYWARVLKAEQERFQVAQEKAKGKEEVVVEASERRISQQEEDEFFTLFNGLLKQGLVTIPDQQEIITECRALFDGTTDVPNKKRLGEIVQPFAKLKKTEHESHYKRMAQILLNVAAKPRTTEAERQQKRMQEKATANLRKLKRENVFVGLDHMRQLARQFTAPPALEHTLTPLKRVNAAIEALSNMHEFLEECGYLIHGQPQKNMQECDLYHARHGQPDLVQLLVSNHQLSDALEYNAGQLLQHLDTIKGYTEAQVSKYLTVRYESLRNLRNYIEHGDPLTETQDFDLNKDSPSAFHHQKVLAPKIIELIFELLPDLLQIKEAMTRNRTLQAPPGSAPVGAVATEKTESSGTPESAKKLSVLVSKSIFNHSTAAMEAEDSPSAAYDTLGYA